MSHELDHIWSRVQAQLALIVDEPTYRIWLEPLQAVELTGERLTVAAPAHAQRWVAERFSRAIQASAEAAVGGAVTVEILPAAGRPSTGRPSGRPASTAQPPASSHPATPPATRTGPLGNPKLTFDQFVIGDCNRLAHAAALCVAELPGQAYTPLFICGPPGVGKTHLLSSIANLLLTHHPGLTVRCATGESFTNDFLAALASGSTDTFKLRFRDVDVLLLDDVQFLERKLKTEEEFFHTFNALHDSGRQIVLTSDRPPHDLQALEDRLRERFQSGLVADVQAPDLATRLAILRKRVQHDHIDLADTHALAEIAQRIISDVRTLEGALIRIVAFSSLTGRPVTAELAREVLDNLYPATRPSADRTRTVTEIQTAICEHFSLSSEELLSSSRTSRIAWPRQLAMYLARELTGQSLPAIGRQFGGRDHTTVLHAWRRTSTKLATDPHSRDAVDKLCHALGHTPPPPVDADDRAS
ncbi:MAG TPA: chromosomal replication initiator protein DnaA [Solirubrobacteraceae bacterium]|nr:chromosomal replication initiator protein DnaA [Solirubrobacteraceae bacterium]